MSPTTFKQIEEVYYDLESAGGYGGVDRLYNKVKNKGITRAQVKEFLRNQDAYTLHKPIRKKFARNRTIVGGIDHQWQADLADLNDITKYNDGYRYLLTVINCFSKFAWAIPLKKKDSSSLVEAFKTLLVQSHPRKPKRLQTDKGKEFLNTKFQQILEQNNIHHFVTQNETKAAMVERFNRTLKTKMFTYFTAKNTYRYLEVLPKLLTSYNNSIHRTIGMCPKVVSLRDENKIWHRIYGKDAASKMSKIRFNVGDNVRIVKFKTTFEKGYLPNWTTEIFRVTQVISHPQLVYKLEDLMGEEIAGTFYENEIQKVYYVDKEFTIEKVLKKRKVKGVEELFVKWKGWPTKFNSWIKSVTIINEY